MKKAAAVIALILLVCAVSGTMAETDPPSDGEWQELYLNYLPEGQRDVTEEIMFTVNGTDLANMPAGTVLARYSFRTDAGKRDELITISKPQIPQDLADRISARNEAYLLYRNYKYGSWSPMLIVFPQSQDCGVTVGHDLTAANENGFIGAGFLCSYWYMCWYSDFFFAGAIQYPGLKDFSVYGENETSLLNEVTETSFPIYKTDVEEILNNI